MSSSNHPSRVVSTNQEGLHPDLLQIVQRHLQHHYQHPLPQYAYELFQKVENKRREIGGQLIVDAGCGTAQSTQVLAERFPGDFVLGIDQSEHRLNKKKKALPENVLLIRANLIDIWMLMHKRGWKIDQHYLLYPNPWPKKKHLQRRWHGHPVFPVLLNVTRTLELRSNWKIYLEEFSEAVALVTGNKTQIEIFMPGMAMTLFEKKYSDSKQVLYSLKVELN